MTSHGPSKHLPLGNKIFNINFIIDDSNDNMHKKWSKTNTASPVGFSNCNRGFALATPVTVKRQRNLEMFIESVESLDPVCYVKEAHTGPFCSC